MTFRGSRYKTRHRRDRIISGDRGRRKRPHRGSAKRPPWHGGGVIKPVRRQAHGFGAERRQARSDAEGRRALGRAWPVVAARWCMDRE